MGAEQRAIERERLRSLRWLSMVRLEYTAIGDMVNLASRVESLTKDLAVMVLATA